MPKINRPQFIVVHHTDSSRDKTTIAAINSWHQKRWPKFKSELGYFIGYHFVITGDGKITRTRNDHEEGAHTETADYMNLKSIGICLTGNFENEQPSDAQLSSLENLITELKTTYQQITDDHVSYHGAFDDTKCCGKNLIEYMKNRKKKMQTMSIAVIGKYDESFERDLAYHVLKYSRGRLTIKLKSVSDQVVSDHGQDRANELRHQLCDEEHFVLILTNPEPEIYKTFATDDLKGVIAVCGRHGQTVSFEVSHMLTKWYNMNRSKWGLPFIENEDVLTPFDDMRFRKYDVVMPYIDLILGTVNQSTSPDMLFEQVRAEGEEDVYILRDLGQGVQKTLVLNERLLQLIGDFSKVKVIKKEQLDAIPDSGGSIGWLPRK